MKILHKQHKRIILDLECYDDLPLESLDWNKVLGLEGDEKVTVTIKEPYENLV